MVASRQVEIPFCEGIGRQRGWRLGALTHVIGKTESPFWRKNAVSTAKVWELICWNLLHQNWRNC